MANADEAPDARNLTDLDDFQLLGHRLRSGKNRNQEQLVVGVGVGVGVGIAPEDDSRSSRQVGEVLVLVVHSELGILERYVESLADERTAHGNGFSGGYFAYRAHAQRIREHGELAPEAGDCVDRHALDVNGGDVRTLGRHPHEIPLALRSAQLWRGIDDLLSTECGLVVTGQARLAETDADLGKLETRVALLHELGYEHEKLIDGDVLMQLVPAVSAHCMGGLPVSGDGFVNLFG